MAKLGTEEELRNPVLLKETRIVEVDGMEIVVGRSCGVTSPTNVCPKSGYNHKKEEPLLLLRGFGLLPKCDSCHGRDDIETKAPYPERFPEYSPLGEKTEVFQHDWQTELVSKGLELDCRLKTPSCRGCVCSDNQAGNRRSPRRSRGITSAAKLRDQRRLSHNLRVQVRAACARLSFFNRRIWNWERRLGTNSAGCLPPLTLDSPGNRNSSCLPEEASEEIRSPYRNPYRGSVPRLGPRKEFSSLALHHKVMAYQLLQWFSTVAEERSHWTTAKLSTRARAIPR
ncbi:hypothetical protein Pcinc_026576 [Petrolisthes cinctipes]|uniref:Uncharacterized protein n=1 Tax=Petrolisthes cinctipes TaxID=88211 RepID=A0AAE1KC42_PETCI|nr:hypothetical protein Pcinc_026576 [Petrolisthes cinctipes]